MRDRLHDNAEYITLDTGHDVKIKIRHTLSTQKYTINIQTPFSRFGFMQMAKYDSMDDAKRQAIVLTKRILNEYIDKLQDALDSIKEIEG